MTQHARKVLGVFLSIVSHSALAQSPPQVADLGNCRLSNDSQIEHCFVAYRLFGELNPDRDNAILVPTWFGGQSEDWTDFLGADAYIDTTDFFVIVADAFGNGSSSSPSNSESQQGTDFPQLSIRDMVVSHHRLLTEHLGLSELHAIVGISMGGMQAFEWSVAYPDFADLIVSVAGSPRLGPYDLYVWKAMLRSINRNRGRPRSQELIAAELAPLFQLIGSTTRQVDETEPTAVDSILTATERQAANIDFDNLASQLQAMITHDISRHTDSDLSSAASTVAARMLVVYSPDDHVVTPYAAKAFSQLVGAQVLSVPSDCGHGVTRCEIDRIGQEIRTFLKQ